MTNKTERWNILSRYLAGFFTHLKTNSKSFGIYRLLKNKKYSWNHQMGLACKLTNRFLNDACSIDSIYLQKEEKSRHRQNEVGN